MERSKKVLVVGDIMIDRYHHVKTERFAPEAAIPVYDFISEESRLGGAGNVALNLIALGEENIDARLAGIARNTDIRKFREIKDLFVYGGQTMFKDRYVNGTNIIFRVDNIRRFSKFDVKSYKTYLEEMLKIEHEFDALVISDYDKGTIDEYVVSLLNGVAPLKVVDSKRSNLSIFKGFDVLKLNSDEFEAQDQFELVEMFKNVVVTRGKDGAQLKRTQSNKTTVSTETFPVSPVEQVVDVTGCGDTHTAAMTFSLLLDPDVRKAIKFANECARSVVQKFGTSTPK